MDGVELTRSSHPRLSVDRTTPEASGIDRVEVSDTMGTTRSLQVQVQVTEPLTGREAELRCGRSATAAAGTDTRHPLCRDLDAPLGERLHGEATLIDCTLELRSEAIPVSAADFTATIGQPGR